MTKLLTAFYIILFLALIFGTGFFLFPLFLKMLKLPTTFIIGARSYIVTLFLGISTFFLLGSFSVQDALSSAFRTMTNINSGTLLKSYTQAIVYLIAFVIIIAIIVMAVLFSIHRYM